MAISKAKSAWLMLASGQIVLCIALSATLAKADATLSVTLLPNTPTYNTHAGAGFGVFLLGQTSSLTVNLSPQTPYWIQSLGVRDSGYAFWNRTHKDPSLYRYQAIGIGRDDDHGVGFRGTLGVTVVARPGGAGGTVTTITDAAVADIRLPFHEIAQSDGSGLSLPPGMVTTQNGVFPDTITPGATGRAVTFSVTPHWAGGGGYVGYVDFLTSVPAGQTICLYRGDGTRIPTGGIPVPSSGLSNEPLIIVTDQNFNSAVTLTAEFHWYNTHTATASEVKAVDYMVMRRYGPLFVCAVGFSGSGYNIMYKNSTDRYDSANMTFCDSGSTSYPVGWDLLNPSYRWHFVVPPAIPVGTYAARDPACFTRNTTPHVAALVYMNSQDQPANVRLVGTDVGAWSTQIMSAANPFAATPFAVLEADMATPLGNSVFNATDTFNWSYDFNAQGNQNAPNLSAGTTNHQFFVTLATPLTTISQPSDPPTWNRDTCTWSLSQVACATTARRVDWATQIAKGASTITAAADKFARGVYGGGTACSCNVSNPWAGLDSGVCGKGDCITLATVASAGMDMVGAAATPCWSWPTADGSPNFPAVRGATCRSLTTTVIACTVQGQSGNINARLIYTGNNYEGFFTVNDPGVKGYTVFPPNGPFDNQTYYYLQVLDSIANVDQLWVANGDQWWPNGVRLWDGTILPNCPTVPRPAVPGP